ncbi:MAG TPA: DUF5984 family protein [Thermosynechococcaceae cyanobacterium]
MDTYELLVSWQRDRRLSAAHLQNSPIVWIWSTDLHVFISWDNTDRVVEGIQVWSIEQGHYRLDRSEFLKEVQAFHDKLTREMAERVERVCDRGWRPEVSVNLEHLKHKQHDRGT